MFLKKFIGGNNINEAIKLTSTAKYIPIFDFAKEASKKPHEVLDYTIKLSDDIDTLRNVNSNGFLALKISSFYQSPNGAIFMNGLIKKSFENNIKILIDAEQDSMKEIEKKYINQINKNYLNNIFKTYQMYRKDALCELVHDINSLDITNFKIVRGAYMRQDESNNVLLKSKKEVDISYDKGIKIILESMKTREDIKLMAATHNNNSVEKILSYIDNRPDLKDRIYFAQLLGMSDSLTNELIKNKMNTCKYVPYGSFLETLPYLVRRLYENYEILKYI